MLTRVSRYCVLKDILLDGLYHNISVTYTATLLTICSLYTTCTHHSKTLYLLLTDIIQIFFCTILYTRLHFSTPYKNVMNESKELSKDNIASDLILEFFNERDLKLLQLLYLLRDLRVDFRAFRFRLQAPHLVTLCHNLSF